MVVRFDYWFSYFVIVIQFLFEYSLRLLFRLFSKLYLVSHPSTNIYFVLLDPTYFHAHHSSPLFFGLFISFVTRRHFQLVSYLLDFIVSQFNRCRWVVVWEHCSPVYGYRFDRWSQCIQIIIYSVTFPLMLYPFLTLYDYIHFKNWMYRTTGVVSWKVSNSI